MRQRPSPASVHICKAHHVRTSLAEAESDGSIRADAATRIGLRGAAAAAACLKHEFDVVASCNPLNASGEVEDSQRAGVNADGFRTRSNRGVLKRLIDRYRHLQRRA